MDGGCGGEERRVPHKEGAEGALGEERGALRRDVLAASHAVVDLEVQGLVLLLDSGRKKKRKKNERKVKGKKSRGHLLAGGEEGVMHRGTGGTTREAAHPGKCCARPTS